MGFCEAARRVLDLITAAVLLAIVAPLWALIVVAIRCESDGPALFRQPRVGAAKRVFTLYKFRTMRLGGDDSRHRALIAAELRGEDTSIRGSWKLDADPRITRVGGLLRRTSLDELPQLLNVLRGDMTLVGPRPCLEWEAILFPPEFAPRFTVKPGLTGLWQVSGRSRVSTLDMLRMDVCYVQTRSLLGDLRILWRTLPSILGQDGAR
jgi:lipopolysaccharide/colanic/teichoic acid biosynthesis glycosyltransferase